MATVQATVQDSVSNSVDLINLVYTEATWKDLLIELVDKNKLDPWDIDIVEIVNKYIDTIKKMKVVDLRIPANIILAASILLRLKSSIISFEEQEEEAATDEPRTERPAITVEGLNLRLRVPPKRRISLKELIDALEAAIKAKEERITRTNEIITVPITIENIDIEAVSENVYRIVKENVDKSKMVTFSTLMQLSNFRDVLLELFVPLLFLEHDGKVSLMQERFFDEIIVALHKWS